MSDVVVTERSRKWWFDLATCRAKGPGWRRRKISATAGRDHDGVGAPCPDLGRGLGQRESG